jgi:hypothetical protein
MSCLILPRRFFSQPQGVIEVDPELQAASAFLASSPYYDLVTRKPLVLVTAGQTEAGPGCLAVPLGTTQYARIESTNAVSPGSEFLAVVVYENTAVQTGESAGILVGAKRAWNSSGGFMFESKDTEHLLELNGGGTSLWPKITVTGIGSFDGKIRTVIAHYKGTTVSVYMDGIFYGSATVEAAGAWADGVAYGNYPYGSASNQPKRRFYAGAILRYGDPISISANPWQLFKAK